MIRMSYDTVILCWIALGIVGVAGCAIAAVSAWHRKNYMRLPPKRYSHFFDPSSDARKW